MAGEAGALSAERLQVARCPTCHRGFLMDALQLGSVLCHGSVVAVRRRQRKQALQVLSVVVAVRRRRQQKQALQVLSVVVAVKASPSKTSKSILSLAPTRHA